MYWRLPHTLGRFQPSKTDHTKGQLLHVNKVLQNSMASVSNIQRLVITSMSSHNSVLQLASASLSIHWPIHRLSLQPQQIRLQFEWNSGAAVWRDTQLLRPRCKKIYVLVTSGSYLWDPNGTAVHQWHPALPCLTPLETTPCCSLSTRQHPSTHDMHIYCLWLARFPNLLSMCGISSRVNALSADLQDLESYIRYNNKGATPFRHGTISVPIFQSHWMHLIF